MYETGVKVIPLKHLFKLSNYYKVSIDYLLGLTNNKYNKLNCIELNQDIIRKQIIDIRNEFNLSQREFADKLNTSHSAISRYEIGKVITPTLFLLQLAKTYNISIDYICGRSNNKYIKKN